jgi:hypothetical protein
MTWRAGDAECDESKPGGSPRLTAGQIGSPKLSPRTYRLFSIHVAYLRFIVFAVAAKSARTFRACKILPNKRAGLRSESKRTFMRHSSR